MSSPEVTTPLSDTTSSIASPVWLLPDELLVEIFTHYCNLWRRSRTPDTIRHKVPHYGWIKITHVCRRWREVATHAPLLWEYVLVTSAECVESMITRTASVPLRVQGSLSCSDRGHFPLECPASWKAALKASSRIESLLILFDSTAAANGRDRAQVADWTDVAIDQFPSLTTLDLLGWELPTVPITVLPPMFNQHASLPSLNTLVTDSFSFVALRPLLSASLRSLTMLNFSGGGSLTWRELLECLSNLTSLEDLTIDDPCPRRPWDIEELPLVLDQPVVLPSLSFLKTTNCDDAGAVSGLLLRNLRFSAKAHLDIGYGTMNQDDWEDEEDEDLWDEEDSELHIFMRALSLRLSGETTIGPPMPILTLGLFDTVGPDDDVERTEILGSTSTWSIQKFPQALTKPASVSALSFVLRATGSSVEHRLAALSSLHPLDMVKNLALDCDAEYFGLRDGLAHLTNVTSIWVSGRALSNLLDALVPKLPDYPQVLFPNLEELHVSSIRCTTSPGSEQPTEDMLHLLVTLRALSHKEGYPVKRLILTRCSDVTDGILGILLVLVEEVFWNGRRVKAEIDE